ncbi:MAG: sigma-70 family RNA polymerase sigma factor [Bacteroidaceae bacterium]|nr:sigma-70 family RNA polymerase sigma factor [Bacteroidaceae bacterium]
MSSKETLLARLQEPSTRNEAFAEVVRTHSRQLYMQIRRLVTWHDDADDVLQNTFIKAWQALDSFRGDSQISTWLYRIAMNESLTYLQKRSMEQTVSDNDAMAHDLAADPYFDGEKAEQLLQEAIEHLPEKQRLVFCMKYFDGQKYEEMSQILGTSVGALKASYHIAVKKIESYFEDAD